MSKSARIVLLAVVLISVFSVSSAVADEPMSPEVMRATLSLAAGKGESVGRNRQRMFQSLLAQGPAAADVIGQDVADRLGEPRRGGHSQEFLIQLAGGFGERGAMCVPALTEIAAGQTSYAPAAIAALGKIGPPARPSVPTLIARDNPRDMKLRFELAIALGRIGGDQATKQLQRWLTDEQVWQRAAAQWALALIDPNGPKAQGYRSAALDAIVAGLKQDDGFQHAQARQLAAAIGAPVAGAVAPLIADPKLRARAVLALYAAHTGQAEELYGSRTGFATRPQRLRELSPRERASLASLEPHLLEMARTTDAGARPALELLGALFPTSDAAVAAMVDKLDTCTSVEDPPINALTLVGRDAIPVLLERYRTLERNDRERGWVLAALVRIDPASVPDLDTVLEPPLPLPKTTMSEILAYAGEQGVDVMLNEVRPNGQRSAGGQADLTRIPQGETAIAPIMARLAQADDLAAAELSRALGSAVRPQDVPVVMRELATLPPNRRMDAIHAVVPPLRVNREAQKRYITDASAAVRLAAVVSLYGESDAEAISLLVTAWATDADADVRAHALKGLQGYGGATTIAELTKRIATFPEPTQLAAVELIGQFRIPEATAALESLLKSQRAAIRAAAVGQLWVSLDQPATNWPTPAAERLATDPAPAVRAGLARTLVRRGTSLPVSPLALKLTSDQSPEVRFAAAQAIVASVPPNRPQPAPVELVALLFDTDPAVRGLVRAQSTWSLTDVVEPFRRALARDRAVQLSVLELLARGASPELRSSIEPLAASPDALVRAYAAAALGGLPPDPAVVTKLSAITLRDDDPTVKAASRRSLSELRKRLSEVRTSAPNARPAPATAPTATRPSAPRQSATQRTGRTIAPTTAPSTRPTIGPSPGRRSAGPLTLTFPEPTTDDERDVVAIARAYAGVPSDDVASHLLDMVEQDDPDRSSAAAWALHATCLADLRFTRVVIEQATKRSPLTRAIVGQIVVGAPRPMGEPATPPGLQLEQLAEEVGRAADIGKLSLKRDPIAPAHPAEWLRRLLDDPNSFVRLAALRWLDTPRAGASDEVLPIVLARLDDPDADLARMVSSVGSHVRAFGDGGVPTDMMHFRDACNAMALQIARSEPGERAALVKESLTVAGDSPFLNLTWIQLLGDFDPAVRAAAAQNLRRYNAASRAGRNPSGDRR